MSLVEISADNAEEYRGFIDEDMIENLDRAFFRGLGVEDDEGEPAGALVFEIKNSESEEDTRSRIRLLNVSDEAVKGQQMEGYSEAVSEEEVVESFYESADESLPSELISQGFTKEESESQDLSVTVADVKKIAGMFKAIKTPSYITGLSDMSTKQFRSFVKNCLFNGKRGLLEDLAYLPKTWFEEEISSCALTDDELTGVLLFRQLPSGSLHAVLYTAFGPDFQRNLSLLLARTIQKVVELYPDDTVIVVRRHNDTVKKLMDKLFAGRAGARIYSGSRAEK